MYMQRPYDTFVGRMSLQSVLLLRSRRQQKSRYRVQFATPRHARHWPSSAVIYVFMLPQ
jgi:hypothetical protein